MVMKYLDRRLRRGGEEIVLGIRAAASSPSTTLVLSAPPLAIGRRQERPRQLGRDAGALDRAEDLREVGERPVDGGLAAAGAREGLAQIIRDARAGRSLLISIRAALRKDPPPTDGRSSVAGSRRRCPPPRQGVARAGAAGC
jgi:hypothetical protein